MPEGGVIIISLRNSDLPAATVAELPAGRYIQLTIADNGRGIPPEIRSRIFEPYFTTKSTGNGLGLATVHSIVRKHQGQIEVDSAVGKGTTFTLWLPAAESRPAPAPRSPRKPRPTSPGRILFMDDEPPSARPPPSSSNAWDSISSASSTAKPRFANTPPPRPGGAPSPPSSSTSPSPEAWAAPRR
jgi:hypothetical protein